jgi:uncharacterized membrane protein
MHLGQFISIASAIVALAGMAGLALVRGNLTAVREQNKDLRDEVGDLTRREEANKGLRDQQAADIAALQRIVTGEVQWQSISDLLDHHHKAAQEQWHRHEDLLGRHEDLLIEIRDLLGRRSE